MCLVWVGEGEQGGQRKGELKKISPLEPRNPSSPMATWGLSQGLGSSPSLRVDMRSSSICGLDPQPDKTASRPVVRGCVYVPVVGSKMTQGEVCY